MKHFLIKLTVFFTPLIILFFVAEYIITKGLHNSKYTEYKEWNPILDGKINADVIVLGTSRARSLVSTTILDSVLNINSFNLGIDGYHLEMALSKYNIYRKHNTPPKIVILCFDIFILRNRTDLYNFHQFLPYIWDNDIRENTRKYIGLSNADYYVPAYRYFNNRFDKTIWQGVKSYYGTQTDTSLAIKGYLPVITEWNKKYEPIFLQRFEEYVEEKYIQQLDSFLYQCTNEKIEVFMVYPPEYYEGQKRTTNRKQIMNIYYSFAKKYNFKWIDYSDNSLFKNKNLFTNIQHLNKAGSEEFSLDLAKKIKNTYE